MTKRGSSKGRGSRVKEFIAHELERDAAAQFPVDDEFEPQGRFSGDGKFIESAGRIDSEERVLDELLMSVPQNQGYYLKLYKVLRPNEYELKERVDNWQSWSDMEWEVTKIVRAHSLKEPKKWGTAPYRVVIWRDGGMRGDKFRPLDFYVDAQEPTADAPINIGGASAASGLLDNFGQLNEMLKTMREVNPTMSPVDVQKAAMDSFQQGLGLALKKEEGSSNSSTQMMTVMMQGMMAMMTAMMSKNNAPEVHKDPVEQFTQMMAVMKANTPEKPTDNFFEQLIKAREMGLIEKPAKNDPMSQMGQMRDMMSMVTDLAGFPKGDRPGVGEKLVEILAPRLPDMIGNISSTIKGFIDYQKMKAGMLPSRPLAGAIEGQINEQHITQPVQEDPQVLFNRLLTELHQIVISNDTNQYGYIQQQITKLFGSDQVLKDLANNVVPQSQILNQLRTFGGSAYQDATFSVQLDNYFASFVEWYRQTSGIGSSADSSPVYVVKCNSCGSEFEYVSQREFELDTNKSCTDCHGGTLVGVGDGYAAHIH